MKTYITDTINNIVVL